MAVDKVTISGYEIQVKHDTTPERLGRLVLWVDKLICEKKEKFNTSLIRSVLLVALDLADRLDNQRGNFEQEVREKLQHLIQEIDEVV